MEKDKGLYETFKSQIIILTLLLVGALWITEEFDIFEPGYTIQDVYVHCYRNPDTLITHRGDNCSNVMNVIYNENENWTRFIYQDR